MTSDHYYLEQLLHVDIFDSLIKSGDRPTVILHYSSDSFSLRYGTLKRQANTNTLRNKINHTKVLQFSIIQRSI